MRKILRDLEYCAKIALMQDYEGARNTLEFDAALNISAQSKLDAFYKASLFFFKQILTPHLKLKKGVFKSECKEFLHSNKLPYFNGSRKNKVSSKSA